MNRNPIMTEQKNIQIEISYQTDNDMFKFKFIDVNMMRFCLDFTPEELEDLSNALIKMVKDYNLMQAKSFKNREEFQKNTKVNLE